MVAVSNKPYPKPGAKGGKLIRQMIGFLKDNRVVLPSASHILIAVSGGADSVALAHLLVHFGRRVVSRSEITLLHVNHGWRGHESDQDEEFVKSLGKKWEVPVVVRKISPPDPKSGESWEDQARRERKKVFQDEVSRRNGALIFTAHHGDDLAETFLWRLLTGAAKTHSGGIVFRHGVEIRPLLKTRKSELKEYLAEVGESFHEDSTNQSERFLRARMRTLLMPEMEKLFPKAVTHLMTLALEAQAVHSSEPVQSLQNDEKMLLLNLLGAAGIQPRRVHLEKIIKKSVANQDQCGEIHLPGGWRLIWEKGEGKKSSTRTPGAFKDRWILQQI